MIWPTVCIGCGRQPGDIYDYIVAGYAEGMSAAEYVMREEGTFNEVTGPFACDGCYIAMGCPSLPEGWKASMQVPGLDFAETSEEALGV